MTDNKISEALQTLRKDVENLGDDYAELRQKLVSLVTEFEERKSSGEPEHHHGLLDDMKSRLSQFEVEHPTATGLLNEIMVTLSNLGI